MRLLHFDHSRRLVSTDFRGKTIPQYAILSHRWGDDEVLFQDLGSNTYKEKDGYRKIKFCAKQAAQDQLQYFWIDTCCINKWNRQELSTAINSMFRWYKNAAKCYVFLSDVLVPTAIETPQLSDWEASFRTCDWFKRGWTLQELIAPALVDFFSCEGQWLGNKKTLEQLIHEITSIPLKALQNGPLDEFTRDERKEWAANRKTKQEEDIVYCLLGILDISMPISYNEGKAKAWKRLDDEIEAANNAPFIVPYSQNDHFVGRESQLADLEARLFREEQTTTVAIVGPGGTGKSHLALELAYRTKQKRKGSSVFWVDAGDIDSLHQGYSNIAQKLDLPGWEDDKVDVKTLVKQRLSAKGAGHWLLIFDNADDIGPAQTTSLVDYLPKSDLCSILFTTTNYNTAERLASQNAVELGAMVPETAQRMLENYLGTLALPSLQQEAKLLLEELSHLPLAIVQAAAYINTRGITLQEYRSKLVRQEKEALERSSRSSGNVPQVDSTERAIAMTLLISVDQIRETNTLAANYLFLAASVERKDIPLDLLEASSPREREDTIKVLSSYALVTRRPADSAFDLHRLVHRALREWLEKEEQLGQYTQDATKRLVNIFPDYTHDNRSKWRRLLPHALYALLHSVTEQKSEERLELAWKCAMTLYSDGRYDECEKLEVQVMETSLRVLGDEHPNTLTSIANLASTYRNQGRWTEAEKLEVQVMETSLRVLGDEHPNTLTSIANLASTYRYQGWWTEAEKLEVQVMETRKRVLRDEHPDTLNSIANLASTYRNQGRWTEAKKLEVQVMETSLRVLGDEHPDTLTSMANLASTYRYQGRWTEAEKLEVQVMETRKRVLGDEHPNTLTSIANLASTLWNQGRWTEAEKLEVQVMETRKRVLGDKHPDTLTSMSNLASTLSNQGRWTEAEKLEVQVMETSLRVLGDEHPDTLTSMSNLASTLSNQGRWTEAEKLEVQVMETSLRVLGDEHPDTLTSMANLASTYRDQGRWTEAEELQAKELEICSRVLGDEHPDTLTSIANLASTLWNQGRWTEAEKLEVQVMETSLRVLGDEHPDTLTSMANLASTYRDQGQWTEAEELQAKELEICSRVLGDEHPDTLISMANLALTYRKQGQWTEAEELQAKELEICSRVLGDEHPNTLNSMNNLAHTLKGIGHHDRAISMMDTCVNLQIQVLGAHHPHTISSLQTLNTWRGEREGHSSVS
ncbi:kinesin light chain 3 [Dendryphion nanum]|uniref:Kinesin light chain 3 n=1 Tax=Dendryphion nanum TaxID=256645 RepID=A0A9P9IQ04_9PLEO|nr:kinesin light chain 3 [Dendryphion nanum]